MNEFEKEFLRGLSAEQRDRICRALDASRKELLKSMPLKSAAVRPPSPTTKAKRAAPVRLQGPYTGGGTAGARTPIYRTPEQQAIIDDHLRTLAANRVPAASKSRPAAARIDVQAVYRARNTPDDTCGSCGGQVVHPAHGFRVDAIKATTKPRTSFAAIAKAVYGGGGQDGDGGQQAIGTSTRGGR